MSWKMANNLPISSLFGDLQFVKIATNRAISLFLSLHKFVKKAKNRAISCCFLVSNSRKGNILLKTDLSRGNKNCFEIHQKHFISKTFWKATAGFKIEYGFACVVLSFLVLCCIVLYLSGVVFCWVGICFLLVWLSCVLLCCPCLVFFVFCFVEGWLDGKIIVLCIEL